MKKRILAIVLCFCLVFTLAGCNISSSKSGNEETKSVDFVNSLKRTSASDVAEGFIESLINKNYGTAVILLGSDSGNPFFTGTDIEWYLPRSNYANIEKFQDIKYTTDVTETESGTSSNTAIIDVSVSEKGKKDGEFETFTVNLVRDDSNNWLVNAPEFYVENWHFATPGGDTNVFIDDNDILSQEFSSFVESKTFGNSGLRKERTISIIGKSPKIITLKAEEGFGTAEFNVSPTENTADEPYDCCVKLTDETAYTSIENIWNNCYKDICDGKQASDLIKYISKSADTNVSTIMYNGISSNDNILSGKNSNFICSNVRACSSEDYSSQYLTDKIVCVWFNYNMRWHYRLSFYESDYTMNNYAKIYLSYEDSEYVVYDAGDKFFSWYNQFTDNTK